MRLALSCRALQIIMRKTRQAHAIGEVLWHGTTDMKTFIEQGTSKFNPTWRDFNLQHGCSSCCSTCFLYSGASFKGLKLFLFILICLSTCFIFCLLCHFNTQGSCRGFFHNNIEVLCGWFLTHTHTLSLHFFPSLPHSQCLNPAF